jgi:hypothetical protein
VIIHYFGKVLTENLQKVPITREVEITGALNFEN